MMIDAARSAVEVVGLIGRGAFWLTAAALVIGVLAGPPASVPEGDRTGSVKRSVLGDPDAGGASHLTVLDPTGQELATITRFRDRGIAVTSGPEFPLHTAVWMS